MERRVGGVGFVLEAKERAVGERSGGACLEFGGRMKVSEGETCASG